MRFSLHSSVVAALLVGVSAFVVAAPAAHAQIFDAAADYSRFNNPNGVWSSGFTNTLGSALVLYDTNNGITGGLNGWFSSTIGVDPNFSKNLGGIAQIGVDPGQTSLHPGPANQY